MNKLPPDTNIDYLKGKTLLQACFGANDLILNFSDNVQISIFSAVGVGIDENKKCSNFENISVELLKLLNKDISGVSWKADGTVTLTFDDGSALRIFDDSQQFESYTIKSSTGLLVV